VFHAHYKTRQPLITVEVVRSTSLACSSRCNY